LCFISILAKVLYLVAWEATIKYLKSINFASLVTMTILATGSPVTALPQAQATTIVDCWV
jgi:hypothetical protein